MWEFVARIILRNRVILLALIAVLTAFMGYQGQYVKLNYEFGGLLPSSDSTLIRYQQFQKYFKEDGNIFVIGVQGEELYEPDNFSAWYELGQDLKQVHGVDSVFSEAHLYNLKKSDTAKKFVFHPVVKGPPDTEQEVQAIRSTVRQLPFYKGLIYNDSTHASLMMVYVNKEVMDSEGRSEMIAAIKDRGKQFGKDHMEVHLSGLPYIRTVVAEKVKTEMQMFVVLAILVTSLVLFFLFRSVRVVLFSMLVVGIGVIWSLGTVTLLGYKLTMVMALIPPIIIVIGIPNCVFLLNKYHNEFVLHGNKIKALSRAIHKIGNATFMTNTTTAMGFATFIFTQSSILTEFGVVAAINVMAVFLFSLLIIPIVYSFMNSPKKRHTKHLERQWVIGMVDGLASIVRNHRPWVYGITAMVLVLAGVGFSMVKTSGKIVDDLPQNDPVLQDLHFFEEHFHGVMPLEVYIDMGKKGHATKTSTLRKIEELQLVLAEHPEISRSLSIADVVKFAKQAFYNGNPERYELIRPPERRFISPYLRGAEKNGISRMLVDSLNRRTRVTAQVADIGTIKMKKLTREIQPQLDSIFSSSRSEVFLSGNSILFFKGTSYLVKNLFISLGIAIVIIACIMAFLFNSARMVLVSMIPNLIPLILTAAIMGYFGITIKPSTILVFSIAFGISVDDTIHYLAKYRQELKATNWDIRRSVFAALKETGVSMFYTSVVLFFGFSVFIYSEFGGTQAIGVLVSVTLLIAMLANLVLLPSFLLSLDNSITTHSFEEPVLDLDSDDEKEQETFLSEGKKNIGEDKRSASDITRL